MNAVTDHRYMAHALQLAERGKYTTHPNPRVGCVIVKDDKIIGEGWHRRAGEAHAEVEALAQAGSNARNATAYVTLEPCCHHGRTPPCTAALISSGIRRVVAAMVDPSPRVAGKGIEQLRSAGIEVETGVCHIQAEALNPGHIMRACEQRPYIRCKLAMTLDGRTATVTGESKWITSTEARRDVQKIRARSAAIMTGSGTILADNPRLTVRYDEVSDIQLEIDVDALEQPWRIVIDSRLKTPVTSRIFDTTGRILVACCTENADTRAQLEDKGAVVKSFPRNDGKVDLMSLMHELADMNINEVLLEAGPVLSGAMLQAGLIDELILYVAPRLLGDAAQGLFALPGLDTMAQATALEIIDIRAVDVDWRITARIKTGEEQ